ncbi:hypothetical protein [Rhodococcus jostii]
MTTTSCAVDRREEADRYSVNTEIMMTAGAASALQRWGHVISPDE